MSSFSSVGVGPSCIMAYCEVDSFIFRWMNQENPIRDCDCFWAEAVERTLMEVRVRKVPTGAYRDTRLTQGVYFHAFGEKR